MIELSGKTLGDNLMLSINNRSACVGVIGLGYVGLPLAMAIAAAGFNVLGFDVDPSKVKALNSKQSYIGAVPQSVLADRVEKAVFRATGNFSDFRHCQILIICVPTPLSKQREPDLSYVEKTAQEIARYMQPGTLVVLESTTYPGTTTEVMKPILAGSGLTKRDDFFVGFSPEREDPGNQQFNTTTIPKVVSGDGAVALELVTAFYSCVVDSVVPVSSPSTAEAVKITENVFRAVNIALVNELKIIYDAMGIDVWEVIQAAKTKPFGYQAFYPGPGLGGHCIPIDPFYLTWKAREFDINTQFIELAGQINSSMPRYVVRKTEETLGEFAGKPLRGSTVLVLGLAYKKNVSDIRESPTFKLYELLEGRGAKVDYHDPHVAEIPVTREHAEFTGRKSIDLKSENIASYDIVILSTDHDAVDYHLVSRSARLIIDTRNRFSEIENGNAKIVKA